MSWGDFGGANYGDSTGMDGMGGYGSFSDVGGFGASANLALADILGSDFSGSASNDLSGADISGMDFGFDSGLNGQMSMAQWATPGFQTNAVLGKEQNQSYSPDSTAYGPNMSSYGLGTEGSNVNQSFMSKVARLGVKGLIAAISAKNPALGFVINSMSAAKAGKAGEFMGGWAGGKIGGSVAGPLGGWAGGKIGAMAGRGLDGREASTGAGAAANAAGRGAAYGGEGMGLEDLASLYAASRTNTQPYNTTGTALQSAAPRDLSSIYGPNSQYATELRKQIERRDAASGRRSQYGPRETELMVKLAELEARQRNADAQSEATLRQQNIYDRQQAYREQVEAENRKRQRDASMVRFLQGSGIANDIAGLF